MSRLELSFFIFMLAVNRIGIYRYNTPKAKAHWRKCVAEAEREIIDEDIVTNE